MQLGELLSTLGVIAKMCFDKKEPYRGSKSVDYYDACPYITGVLDFDDISI